MVCINWLSLIYDYISIKIINQNNKSIIFGNPPGAYNSVHDLHRHQKEKWSKFILRVNNNNNNNIVKGI
jgi:hypothetical protein